MHLHLWDSNNRQKGMGVDYLKKSIPIYFETYKLQQLFCEPAAQNQAPNKTLQKLGFTFIKEYETTPGWINYQQKVNQWCLSKESWLNISA
jgi:RimJ/RimL family protein N-acetyltransferase